MGTIKISSEEIKKLRVITGAGIMDCKQALQEAGGDAGKAKEILKKKGFALAKKKATREARQGRIESYIHTGNKIGVLIEVNCETDFVARTEDFKNLVKDLAMQVAAISPQYLSREVVPPEVIEKERNIFREEARNKPETLREKIVEEGLNKWFEENCLLEQTFIKDDKQKVKDYLYSLIAKLGENIVIRRFVRFELGEKEGK